jgi:hypothetical protein
VTRAIATALFCAAGLGAGCSPDLERRIGSVQVVALNLPEAAQTLRATIEAGTARSQVEAALATSGGRLIFDGVPEGQAALTAQALAGTVLAERAQQIEVVAGATSSVTVDFMAQSSSDGGGIPGGQSFGPTPAFVRGLGSSDIRQGLLRAVTEGLDDVFVTQFEAARAALGGSVTSLRVTRLEVALNTAASRDISSLRELWVDEVQVMVVSRDRPLAALIAEGTFAPSASAGTLDPAADQDALAALISDLLSGRADLEISGATALSGGSSFQAELSLLLRWVAQP